MKKKDRKSLNKKSLSKRIQKKLGNTIKQRLIQDAVLSICSKIEEKLVADQAISVEHFGTLSPYVFHAHHGMNIATGYVEKVQSFRTVKFHPHATFLVLLSQRRETFSLRKTGGSSRSKKS